MNPGDHFAVDRTCPSCGTSWEERNDSEGRCPNGCNSVASESYSATDAHTWNERADRRDRGDW